MLLLVAVSPPPPRWSQPPTSRGSSESSHGWREQTWPRRSSASGRRKSRAPPHRPVATSAEKHKKKKKAQGKKIETGCRKRFPLWQQLPGVVLKYAEIRRSVLYNGPSAGCQTDAFRSCPPSRIPLSGRPTARASDVKR